MACDTILDSYAEGNVDGDYDLKAIFSARESAVGQSFTTPVGTQYGLCVAKFLLRKVGSPVGNLVARLYAHTGIFGTSSKPTGPSLAESDTIALASLSGVRVLKTFTFSQPYYVMDENTHYCIVVLVKDATTIDASNKGLVGVDSSSPTHAGNVFRMWSGNAWLEDAAIDAIFYVYGEAVKKGASGSIVPLMKGLDLI